MLRMQGTRVFLQEVDLCLPPERISDWSGLKRSKSSVVGQRRCPMEIKRYKYPRSYHLPWSEGATDDDKTLTSADHFVGQEVVVSCKLDGENTSIYPDGHIHARSLDSQPHDSRNWVRALVAQIAWDIPATMRVCGENVFARHSIAYEALDTYFLVFALFEGELSLSWDEVEAYSEMLGLQTVPVLYRGMWDE